MNAEEIRIRAKTSPDWLFVELVSRISSLEKQVEALTSQPKRGRPKKVTNGTVNIHRTASRS